MEVQNFSMTQRYRPDPSPFHRVIINDKVLLCISKIYSCSVILDNPKQKIYMQFPSTQQAEKHDTI